MDNEHLRESSAYQANKDQFVSTPAELPHEAQKLEEGFRDYPGLQERFLNFCKEYYHPFPDLQAVIRDYRNLAFGDLWALRKQPNASELVRIGVELGLRLFGPKTPEAESERILFAVLELVQKELASAALDDVDAVLVLERIRSLLTDQPALAGRCSGRVKNLLRGLSRPGLEAPVGSLHRLCVDGSLDFWSPELNRHWLESFGEIACFAPVVAFLRELAGRRGLPASELPDYDAIAHDLLRLAREKRAFRDNVELLLALFDLLPMRYYQTELLNQLMPLLRSADLQDDREAALGLFELLFPFLARLGHEKYKVVNSILVQLARQVIPSGDNTIIDVFCQRMVSLPFPDPEVTGVDMEWQTLRNPAHLPTIRTYIEIIKLDPDKTAPLLAGLHVNLRIGGVFISDTDLFHADVSELLNSNVKPVYKQLKQVCRLFPVYFRDIGAEGDLRAVSTRIDEVHGREDKLVHFLRKQIHIESNNTQLDLLREILTYWYTGSTAGLEGMIPRDVAHFLERDTRFYPAAHKAVQVVAQVLDARSPAQFLEQSPDAIVELCERGDLDTRVGWLVRIHQLLCAKYDLDAAGARDALATLPSIEQSRLRELFAALDGGQSEAVIDLALDILADLQKVVQDPRESQGEERIYRKRHIAAGIPSMYGSYVEPKLECLGATYRLERLISLAIERLIGTIDLDYITRPALRRICWVLERLIRALELDGIRVHDLRSHCSMLRSALQKEGFTINQFLNVFQVFSLSTRSIIERYFHAFHRDALDLIVRTRCEGEEDQAKLSEKVMRDILSSAFGIGLLDSFLGRITATLVDMRQKLNPETVDLVLSFDADKAIVRLHSVPEELANAVWIGNKGYYIHLLRRLGIKVPWGFAFTTEVYRCRKAFEAYSYMKAAMRRRLMLELQNLEELTGYTLGRCRDGKPPLLLSVRSGAAVSMPGIMMTFLNLGLNPEITEELSRLPNYGWTAWDCYRRMIQLWGMGHGISRDEFDSVMRTMKQRYDVNEKQKFSPEHMRAVASEYLRLLHARGVVIPDDPVEQVLEAVEMVFASWHSRMADVYRAQFDISPEWGTAVLIQRMILGNLNLDSGTGVALVSSRNNRLTVEGDFVPVSQGEDVVCGLVHPHPISEAERARTGAFMSLESQYAQHYDVIRRLGKNLILENDFPEQEIEFTFEDSNPDNLYVLQCRTIVRGHGEKTAVFTDPEPPTLTMGVGAGGGAFVGRVVFSREGIERLSGSGELILVRPDTVPDDVDMIFRCHGLLTARGGVTSHAAVTANRLGKVCVVNCRDLVVYDDLERAECDGAELQEGDVISIDGASGKVFSGARSVSVTSASNVWVGLT